MRVPNRNFLAPAMPAVATIVFATWFFRSYVALHITSAGALSEDTTADPLYTTPSPVMTGV